MNKDRKFTKYIIWIQTFNVRQYVKILLLFIQGFLYLETNSIFKSRDITLATKVHLVKAMVFPVVMYGCELDCEEG